MIKPIHLSRRGGELLLRLLEQSRPVIATTETEELSSEVRSELINAGALERHGVSRSALVAGDDGPTFRDLAWEADQNAYGYFDASDGSVVLAPEAQMLFRVALPWWLTWLAASLALTNSGQPTELVPTSAWDIGDLWVTRQRNIPVLFVRRLHRDATLKALREALQKRAGRNGGLILTSSRNPLQTIMEGQSFQITPIIDVLTNDADGFVIDRALVISPYVATKQTRIVTGPLDLSPDGRRLVINGVTTIDFKSDVHIAIIWHLVAGYREGKRFRASEILKESKSGVTTLARAFGTKKWKQLKPYLTTRNGLWGFDL